MSSPNVRTEINIDAIKSQNYTVSPLELSRVAEDAMQNVPMNQENGSDHMKTTFQPQRSIEFSKQYANPPKNYWTQQSQNTFIDDLQTQLASAKVQYDMLQQQYDDQQQQHQQIIDQYKIEIQRLKDQVYNSNIDKSIHNSTSQSNMLESQKLLVIQKDEQIVTLQYQNSQLQELNNNFQKQMNEREQQIDTLRIEVQQLRLENTRLKQKVELTDQQLQTSMYQSTQTISMQQQIQQLTQSLEEAKADIFNKQAELDRLHQQITLVTLQYDQLKDTFNKNQSQYNLKQSQQSLSTNTQVPYPSAMSTVSHNTRTGNIFESMDTNHQPQQSRGLLMSSYAQESNWKLNNDTLNQPSNRSQENTSPRQIFRQNNSDTFVSQLQSNRFNNKNENQSLDTFKDSYSELYKTQRLNFKNLTMKYRNTNPNTIQNTSQELNKIQAPIRLNYRSKSNPILSQNERQQNNNIQQYLIENQSREQESSESNLTPQYLTKQYFVNKNSDQPENLSPEPKATASLSQQFTKGRSPKNISIGSSSSLPLSTNSLQTNSRNEWVERNDHGIISSIAVIAAVILGVGVYSYQFK